MRYRHKNAYNAWLAEDSMSLWNRCIKSNSYFYLNLKVNGIFLRLPSILGCVPKAPSMVRYSNPHSHTDSSPSSYLHQTSSFFLIDRGPQPPGHGPVLVRGLLGTGPHSRSWAVGERAKLHLPLPIAHITAWTIPPHPPSPHSTASGKIVFHETGP